MAKLIDIEIEGVASAAIDANLKIVGQAVVYLSDIIFWWKVIVNALLQLSCINRVIQQYSIGFFPISASASSFLEIGFDGVGTIDVYHKAHIRFINAHSKRICGHHDAYFVTHPFILSYGFCDML